MLNLRTSAEPERNVWRGGIAYYARIAATPQNPIHAQITNNAARQPG